MRQPFEVKYIPCMPLLIRSDALSEICGRYVGCWFVGFFVFLFFCLSGAVSVIEEIKEARQANGTQSTGSHICVHDPSFLNRFTPGHFHHLETFERLVVMRVGVERKFLTHTVWNIPFFLEFYLFT